MFQPWHRHLHRHAEVAAVREPQDAGRGRRASLSRPFAHAHGWRWHCGWRRVRSRLGQHYSGSPCAVGPHPVHPKIS